MSEIVGIQDQLRRAFEGDAWHGPSLGEILRGVSAKQAAAKPLRGIHSIWETVLHLAAWHQVVCRRLDGEVIGELPLDQDWPVRHGCWGVSLAASSQQAYGRPPTSLAGDFPASR